MSDDNKKPNGEIKKDPTGYIPLNNPPKEEPEPPPSTPKDPSDLN